MEVRIFDPVISKRLIVLYTVDLKDVHVREKADVLFTEAVVYVNVVSLNIVVIFITLIKKMCYECNRTFLNVGVLNKHNDTNAHRRTYDALFNEVFDHSDDESP